MDYMSDGEMFNVNMINTLASPIAIGAISTLFRSVAQPG